jgi:hypothetical protein
MSESYARMICLWTGKLVQEFRVKADEILLGAALGGADLRDLAGLAAEILARSEPADPDGKDEVFQDGTARLETTFRRHRDPDRGPEPGVHCRGAVGAGFPGGRRHRVLRQPTSVHLPSDLRIYTLCLCQLRRGCDRR